MVEAAQLERTFRSFRGVKYHTFFRLRAVVMPTEYFYHVLESICTSDCHSVHFT